MLPFQWDTRFLRIVDSLEKLSATVDSENIRLILENASNDIWYLVYDDEDVAEAA